MKKLLLAKSAGFCFGVNRASQLAFAALEKGKPVYLLGHFIHNEQVINRLLSGGAHCVTAPEQVPAGAYAVIRAHGESRAVHAKLLEAGAEIVDTTCPFVRKIHNIVAREDGQGRQIFIFGDPEHPEVMGIAGWCSQARVFEDVESLRDFASRFPEDCRKPLSIVAQTTSNRAKWEKFVNSAKKLCTNVKFFDTICNATDVRQSECTRIAKTSQVMLVIGDQHSSNTAKLVEVACSSCPRVYRIDTVDNLRKEWFENAEIVGITAGASTPAWIIKEVVNKMSEELENKVGEIEEESFEQMLENSIKTLYTGDKVKGIVTSINSGEINVDLGVKQAGYIPVAELSDDPDFVVSDMIKVGDEIEAFVMRVNDVEGTVMLSKKRLDSIKGWDSIEQAREDRTTVEGVVIEENKGGIVVSVGGVHVFVPASQTGLPKDAPMSELLKQKVQLRITEVNRARRRVVGSIRAIQQEERRAKAEEIWNTIEENKEYEGVVKSLTSYGAFVDIGGVDGMIHISELSWSRVRHPSDVLSVGDKVSVYVISFDKEKRKISLGYRRMEDNPWVKFVSNYGIGDVVPVKVLKFMPFGAFAEIIPGVDGLIHISQIANQRIGKPEDVLTEGEEVRVKITDIDTERQKVSLSIRAALAEREEAERVMADEPQSETVYISEDDE